MKTNLIPGIQNLSGTIKSPSGKKVIFKTYKRANGTTETRAYFVSPDSYQRRTKIKPKEIACRQKFSDAMAKLNALSEEQKKEYAEQAKRSNYTFNGKQYKSIRGYIMARVYAELSAGVDVK